MTAAAGIYVVPESRLAARRRTNVNVPLLSNLEHATSAIVALAGWQGTSLCRSSSPLCGVEGVCLQGNLKMAMQTGTFCRSWLHTAFLDAPAPLFMSETKC